MPTHSTSPTLTPQDPTAVDLAQLAQSGDDTAWAEAFITLADHLLLNDPLALLRLVQQAAEYPLPGTKSEQQLAYFTALAFRKNNRLDEAIAQFTALLARPDLPRTLRARTLNSRAVGYRLRGQLALAQEGYTKSLHIWRTLNDQLNVGKVQLNRGIIAYQLRRFAEAEQFLQEAADCFTAVSAPEWLAGVTNELGLLHRDQGRLDEALAQFDQFLAQRQAEGASEQIGLAYLNRGEILLFQNKLDEAEASLQAAREQMSHSPYRVDVLLHLGLITAVRGDLHGALHTFQQAQQLTYALGRSEILPHVYYHLADSWRRLGQPATARHYLETAVVVIEQQQGQTPDEALSISLLGRWQQVYEALFLVQMALGEPEAAFATAERARARAFAQQLTAEDTRGKTASIPEVQAALPPRGALVSYYTTGVVEHDLPLLRQLPQESTLRDFLLAPPHIWRFVITPQQVTAVDCHFDPNLLTSNSPRGHDPRRFLDERVQATLRRVLWPPDLSPDADSITIIPHGPLHQIPFCLLTPAPTLTPSATIWHKHSQRQQDPQADTAVAIAYAGDGQQAPPLRFVTAEAELVAQALGGQVWPDFVRQNAPLPEAISHTAVVHFACHSWFNLADPLESYLELGPDTTHHLTAAHIRETWRLQARLVTLSACQTGLSRVLRGDEPLGLVRAFLSAGADAVLVTQWPVDDAATFLLMHRFYGLLADAPRAPLAQLLAQAQAWLRTLTREEARQLVGELNLEEVDTMGAGSRPWADPIFWAGFVLVTRG